MNNTTVLRKINVNGRVMYFYVSSGKNSTYGAMENTKNSLDL